MRQYKKGAYYTIQRDSEAVTILKNEATLIRPTNLKYWAEIKIMLESLSCFKDKDLGGKYSKSNFILLTLFFAFTLMITHGWLLFTHAGWIIYDIHMTYDLQFTNHSRNWFCTEQLSVNRYTIAQLMGTYHLLMINYLKLWNTIFQCYSQAASDWWCKGVEVSVRNNMLLFMCYFIQFNCGQCGTDWLICSIYDVVFGLSIHFLWSTF